MHSSPAPSERLVCICCGRTTLESGSLRRGQDGSWRCHGHWLRNPCIIEGCSSSGSAEKSGHGSDDWLCSVHWRRHVPPRSPRRRAYLRLWRIAKKKGWDDVLTARFNRFWYGLVKKVRREAAANRIDVAEINKLFGWDAE